MGEYRLKEKASSNASTRIHENIYVVVNIGHHLYGNGYLTFYI